MVESRTKGRSAGSWRQSSDPAVMLDPSPASGQPGVDSDCSVIGILWHTATEIQSNRWD